MAGQGRRDGAVVETREFVAAGCDVNAPNPVRARSGGRRSTQTGLALHPPRVPPRALIHTYLCVPHSGIRDLLRAPGFASSM